MPVPRLTLLSREEIEQVHRYSLDILARVGVRVDSRRAREVFAASGAARLEGERVYLQPELAEWAIRAAPETINIYNRRGEPAFSLGEGRTRYGIGVTNLYYQEPDGEGVTPFTRHHMRNCVRLANVLERFDLVSTIGILQDLPPTVADLYAVLEMAANTLKPLVVLISDERLFPAALDLLQALHGELGRQPFVVPYLNPVTPLIINEGTADKLEEAIRRGLPVIYSNYGMAGTTMPITPGGALAVLNAELLAGLTLSQLLREGAPIVLGSLPAYFDMQSMVDFYDPRTFLLNLACAEMMAHYRLPHAGTSGSGNGWGADLPEAGALWMDLLSASLGKAGLAPFVGGTLGSKAFSPSTVVYADEIIGQILDFAQGFALDDANVNLGEIAAGVEEGHFLTTGLTLKLYRQAYFQSRIFPHWGLENWEANGSPMASDLLRRRTLQLLAEAQPPEDYPELIESGEGWLRTFEQRARAAGE